MDTLETLKDALAYLRELELSIEEDTCLGSAIEQLEKGISMYEAERN